MEPPLPLINGNSILSKWFYLIPQLSYCIGAGGRGGGGGEVFRATIIP